MKLWKPALVVVATAFSQTTIAATANGTLGDPSTGTVDVAITKQSAAQITGLTAITFTAASSLSADEVETDDVCVFSSSGTYGVTVTTNTTGFNLSDGTNDLPFTMSWGTTAGSGGNAVTDGATLSGESADSTSDPSCGSAFPTEYAITIAANDFNAAAPATYQAELTISIAVE